MKHKSDEIPERKKKKFSPHPGDLAKSCLNTRELDHGNCLSGIQVSVL